MAILGKMRVGSERGAQEPARGPAATPMPASRNVRVSNALKDLLWLLGRVERGCLLDLGSVWQSTVSFFTERGFRVYTEDVLRSWKECLAQEEESLRTARPGVERDPATLASRFLESCLTYPPETFHVVLVWDILDYLQGGLVPQVVERLHSLLKPGGFVLGVFHSRLPDGFSRYRILDSQTVELLPAPAPVAFQHIFQNREILNLFCRFRSAKTFVGRDQIREGLFIR